MSIEQNYQKTLDYLYSFVDYSLSKSFSYSPVKFELGRLRKLMESLGNPHMQYPIIHVAGTKGKGSVTAFCASAFREAGYCVGMYTSPHLHDYTERIQVNGLPISKEDLVRLVDEIKPQIEKLPQLTTFEITTALGFLYFHEQKINVAVIEVGLGGRLDATNIVTPIVAVITSLSYDHTYLLGNTLTEIATEKAGIIKPGIPVVLAPQEDEARLTIERIANERGSPLIQVGKEYLFAPISHSLDEQSLIVWSSSEQRLFDEYVETVGKTDWKPFYLKIPLLGYHQIENAATAFTTIQVFKKAGFDINLSAIQQGFQKTYWPGRFEIIRDNPPIVLDSAHNRDSARKLRIALDDYFPGKKVIMVFGASDDKDIFGMFTELLPRVDEVIATRSFHPRALDPSAIVDMAHQFGHAARIIEKVSEALQVAMQMAGTQALILIAGSIFVVSESREYLDKL